MRSCANADTHGMQNNNTSFGYNPHLIDSSERIGKRVSISKYCETFYAAKEDTISHANKSPRKSDFFINMLDK